MSTNDQLPALPELLTDRELQSLRNLVAGLGSDAADEIVELRAAVAQRDEQIARLKAANEHFAARQEWWNERMFELEQQRDALRAEVEALRVLIADDAYAITFQSFGQYRSALLASIDAARAEAKGGNNG